MTAFETHEYNEVHARCHSERSEEYQWCGSWRRAGDAVEILRFIQNVTRLDALDFVDQKGSKKG
jgi:hypothetical protein